MVRKSKRVLTRARKHSTIKHYFLPGTHNAYRPLFLRLEAIAVQIAIVILLFFVALGVERLVIKNPSPQMGAVVSAVLVTLANADREVEGLPLLATSEILTEAAQMKANDMAEREYFAHETPEGHDPWYWFQEAGYSFRHAGENLAVYFSDSAEVEEAWMDSPLHRANILNDTYTEIGIAVAHGRYLGHETTFVVQMFGNPSDTPSATISSREPESEDGVVAGASAEAKPIGAITSRSSNTLWRVLTSPRTTLGWAYTGIATLIVLAMALLFLTELRRFHVPSLMRGVSLLVVIGILFYGSTFVSGELLIL